MGQVPISNLWYNRITSHMQLTGAEMMKQMKVEE